MEWEMFVYYVNGLTDVLNDKVDFFFPDQGARVSSFYQ